ncbi:MAG: hypothetical protein JXC32_10995, partial [Anaerolineae bacterium]|nr:hypothetical protein [Anaerolineae bacterium]
AILLGYWLLPISGRVLVIPGDLSAGLWPRFAMEFTPSEAGQLATVTVTDIEPWSFVQLLVNDTPAQSQGQAVEQAGTWTWTWRYTVPEGAGYQLAFYHDCHTGCKERGRLAVGTPPADLPAGPPTKLGVVMANPDRDWHGRSGWVVEVAYAQRPEDAYWGLDDLASRVAGHHTKGLRVLVRVDYEQRQSLPPTDDYVALAEYMAYVRRVLRDDRLRDIYGIIIGSDYNTQDASAIAPDRPTTPTWYARLFNGYGEEPTHSDNIVQIARAENPQARIIVGPLRPWSTDQSGALAPGGPDVPWLRYMNTLVAYLDEAARTKGAGGVPLAAPDGFDVQAPGNPDAPELSDALRSEEPRRDLSREGWDGAQAGFRVYRDWLAIINAYPTTRGLPVYIISTNTYNRVGDIPPAQNYPAGWLTTALDVVNQEPQVKALVWFLDDFPHSDEWDWFSLTDQPGRLVDAAEEFNLLLRGQP